METLVLTVIGAAALWYVSRLVWRSLKGETACNCGEKCSGESSCCSQRDRQGK